LGSTRHNLHSREKRHPEYQANPLKRKVSDGVDITRSQFSLEEPSELAESDYCARERIFACEANLVDIVDQIARSDVFSRACEEGNTSAAQYTKVLLGLPRQVVDDHMNELIAVCKDKQTNLMQVMDDFLVNKFRVFESLFQNTTGTFYLHFFQFRGLRCSYPLCNYENRIFKPDSERT